MKATRQQSVQAIGDSGNDEDCERQQKPLIKEQRNKDRNQRHPKDGQQIRQSDNPRGHARIFEFRLDLL